MKQYFIACFVLLIGSFSSYAQKGGETRFQQIESAKVAYITRHLELTPTEAQKFFPIYNQYRNEMREIMAKSRSKNQSDRHHHGIEFDAQLLSCKKKYRNLFSTVVSPSKASRFFEVEREFREQLFKELESRQRKKQ